MKPLTFKESNTVIAEDQPPYLPLPAHMAADGQVISCWELTWKERWRVLWGAPLWLSQLTFNQPLQPQQPTIDCPLEVCDSPAEKD